MICLYAAGGVFVGLFLLIAVFTRSAMTRNEAFHDSAASQATAGCTAGVHLLVEELVERHGLQFSEVIVAAKAAGALYQKLMDEEEGWPVRRLQHGLADGRTLLIRLEMYCAERQEASERDKVAVRA